MSSDIELGDDDSITLECTQLRARHTFTGDAVQVFGNLRVQDRIFLDAPRPPPSSLITPKAPVPSRPLAGAVTIRTSDGSFVGGVSPDTYVGGGSSGTYTGGAKPREYKEVYTRLRNRPVPVDLWEELQMLREAILDLHGRLVKKGM